MVPNHPPPARLRPPINHYGFQRPLATRTTYGQSRQSQLGPQLHPVQLRQRYEGQDALELSVGLRGLHSNETTWNLRRNFERHGTITFIEIYECSDRPERDGGAKIRFSPPPASPFWLSNNGIYGMISVDDQTRYNVRLTFNPKKDTKEKKIKSPIKGHIFYDQQMPLYASALHFGLMVEHNFMMPLQTIFPHQNMPKDLSFIVDLVRKRIAVEFTVPFRDPRSQGEPDHIAEYELGEYDRNNKYMFQVPFDQLTLLHRVNINPRTFGLVISLDSPPQFYRKRMDERASYSEENLIWSAFDLWFRQTDIVYDPYALQRAPIALHKERPVIDIGRWTTYLFEFQYADNSATNFDEMKRALQDYNIEIVGLDRLGKSPPRPAELWSFIDPPTAQLAATDLQNLDVNTGTIALPFEVRYQLEVCISHEILNEYNITRSFVAKLAEISTTDPTKARNILEYCTEQDKRIYNPMTIFENKEALAFSSKTDIPHYCAYVRKATVTPSTVYFSSPTVETTNRVLRHYSRENEKGRFLRVQFTDEIFEGRINSCADKQRNDELFSRVYRTLYNGIRIGDRRYEFLAFGNSQFRENGAYFFCPTEHLSCDDIRDWMGNFSHINVVAKYAARLGQCFSTTRAINGLSAPDIVTIPDIERNGYCFTDGVGKISPFLAQMIAAELKFHSTTPPSAFQFRLGGCKGILVVSPEAEGREVHIRKSQQKFTSTYNGLEIIRCSHFSSATLNRQTITILSALGVPDEVFLRMLSEQLANYQSAMDDDDKAVDMLLRYIDDNQMTINIATMIRNGFMTSRDPFVLSLLHLWRSWSIKLLKEKAKIIVEKGAFVLGCVDESGTLRGYTTPTTAVGQPPREEELPQIFLQVPDKDDPNTYNVIKGICLVGRNPSLHPGDLRVVEAVNVPALHHLRDVVVFPSTGERDVPSMCSGGDLDGDDYFVIWDKELQPSEWNCKPMEYKAPNPKVHNKPVQVVDLMKFFVRFMKNDALPTIAHAHLAHSDGKSVEDNVCLELAALHSKAVDYVKTGEAAEMPKKLRPRQWPHFMEKRHKPKEAIYKSTKILGQLYDRVDKVNFVPQYEAPFDRRILSRYKLDDSLLKAVRQIKSKYDTAMRRIMAQQEISTEYEIWSTFVLSRPRVGSDYKVQEEIGRISEALKEQFRAICIDKAGGKDFEKLGKFVAGMYKVTKEELDIALTECRLTKIVGGREVPRRKMEPRYMPLISFPWLFEKELGRIATGLSSFEDFEDLDLQPLTLKSDQPHIRRRQEDRVVDIEDYIQRADGVIVHRGEELDLFHPDIDMEDSESDFGEGSSDNGHSYMKGAFRETVLATGFRMPDTSEQSLVGTGVEDAVPQIPLDGFIGPISSATKNYEHSASSSDTSNSVVSQSPKLHSPGDTNARITASLNLIDLDDLNDTPINSPTTSNKDESSLSAKNVPRVPNTTLDQANAEQETEEEGLIEEEIVDLEIDESPLEKLERMMSS
ncbi:hypothetical protein G7Y89_g5632 [Cudoniella acicularis]|uniref:RNA-dependent RNA polymerase n=1 Tax=Cudoniella acicularis TaxID=354080 RepID=A0A8H4W6B4_9HELO|nr:hypothetical protein G7Y89_g5632 [Cudoniella acicularis]